jgi:NADH:ubiquinone oxidoreductase subunit 5 (subunit L)/multisubunit Na+/H+ antiporter MnhA subunit
LLFFVVGSTGLYAIQSFFSLFCGFSNWNSFFVKNMYEVDLRVFYVLLFLVFFGFFLGPLYKEIFYNFDLCSYKGIYCYFNVLFFKDDHVYLNWIVLIISFLFIIFYWNLIFDCNFIGMYINFRIFRVVLSYRLGFDAFYNKIGFCFLNFSYKICWFSIDKGWLILIIYYFIRFWYNSFTKVNLLVQNGMVGTYYSFFFMGILILLFTGLFDFLS